MESEYASLQEQNPVVEVGQQSDDRLIGWVDEFVRGFGVPQDQVESLLAGVRGALALAEDEGIPCDRVAVTRREEAVEVELHGAAGIVGTFLLLGV
jgi:hypothetical protein